MKDLSIIILSYNTKEITLRCLEKLYQSLKMSSSTSEVIVVDNASHDGSKEALLAVQPTYSSLTLILNDENKGYGKANNQAIATAEGKYILLLNSDGMIEDVDFDVLIKYMEAHPKVGGLTVRVNLSTGGIDPASHRGFPTIWRSFTYFAKLEAISKNVPGLNNLFGGYHLVDRPLNTVHEIDAPSGAFFLIRADILKRLNGFDEQFFMYGEDLDLAYRIKELGYSMMYYPTYTITHLKYQSGLGGRDKETQRNIHHHFYDSMKIFYRKHYAPQHSSIVNNLMYFIIDLKEKFS